jgi:hypothetical protein
MSNATPRRSGAPPGPNAVAGSAILGAVPVNGWPVSAWDKTETLGNAIDAPRSRAGRPRCRSRSRRALARLYGAHSTAPTGCAG